MLLDGLKNNSKVTVWGYGKEGQAVTAFLQNRGCEVKVVEDPLKEPLTGLVIKSPGISLYRNEIRIARQFSAYFTSATNLFLEAALSMENRPLLVGVTGTKGKSTTSSLISFLFESFGNRVAFGGNIGYPIINYIEALDNYEIVVDEVSSYVAADLKYGFDITVLLNLYPEHIDWHKTHEQYFHDKLNIMRVRGADKPIVLNARDPLTRYYVKNPINPVYYNTIDGIHFRDGWFYDKRDKLFSTDVVPLRGEHNLENVCAALTVMKLAGLEPKDCEEPLKEFHALPHRLQELPEKNGIRFIDDSISTTPETALAALRAFDGRRVVLIAGGFDRQQDYGELADYAAKKYVPVVTIPQTGSRLAEEVRKRKGEVYEAADLKEAVSQAAKLASFGGFVLLSPAAPSYGIFKNFEERGDFFAKCVTEMP